MTRDLRPLADTRFDVLVIGAGVYGAATAWDAAQRGLSVALIDRGDFGGGTSFNNLKTLHGGLRSLQALDLAQMRRFIRERRALARIAAHLVRPLPFIVPTGGRLTRTRQVMRVALAINDLVAHDRSEGIADPALHLPAGRVVSRDEALRLNPFVAPDAVTGGAIWHDYQMTHGDRVTFGFVASAVAAGACAANYVEATGMIVAGNRVAGAHVTDVLGGGTFDVRASVVVNAGGAWAHGLARTLPGRAGAPKPAALSRAINVILDLPAPAMACGGEVDGRFLFLVPWRGVTMLGTSHDAFAGSPDGLTVTRADLEAFLADGRRAFPRADWANTTVRLVHRGLLPMVRGDGHDVQLLRESTVVDHAAEGAPGAISIHGVRYTTARDTAQVAVDAAFRARGVSIPPACRTDVTPLPGGDLGPVEAFTRRAIEERAAEAPADLVARLVGRYGSTYEPVLRTVEASPALAEPLAAGCPTTGAEIVYAARAEMAVTLADALIRRTDAGSAGHPGQAALRRAAGLVAAVHGWDARRVEDEIAAVEAFYEMP